MGWIARQVAAEIKDSASYRRVGMGKSLGQLAADWGLVSVWTGPTAEVESRLEKYHT